MIRALLVAIVAAAVQGCAFAPIIYIGPQDPCDRSSLCCNDGKGAK